MSQIPAVSTQAQFLLSLSALTGVAPAQSPLIALVDWKDGRVADGVGPASAVDEPDLERFWIGQGLRRAQIRIEDRARLFDEEGGSDQNYQTSIVDLELDESSASSLDHRLFVLTGWTPKSGAPARLQVLRIIDPSQPEEIEHVDFDATSPDGSSYDIKDIALIEDEQLVVAVGSKSSPDNRMVLQLYRYAPGAANLEGELPLVAEILRAPIPLQNCGDLGPRVLALPRAVHLHQIDGQWFAFVIGATTAPQKPGPGGVTVCRIDPAAAAPDPVLTWYTSTTHVFDPVYETFCGSLEPCYQEALSQEFTVTLQDVGVNHLDIVELPGSPATHLAYLAGNAFSQILELDVSNFASTGFGPPTRIPIFVLLDLAGLSGHRGYVGSEI
jgi:hypothetical protein